LPQSAYEVLELGYAVADLRTLNAAIRRFRPDVIYERYNLYFPSGVWASRRHRLPLLLEVNAPLYEERSRFDGIALPRLARWSEHFAWRGASLVLPVTEVLADRIVAAGVPRERVRVIPNGINADAFSRLPARDDAKRALGLQGRLVLGFVGFMRDWHGLDRVLEFTLEYLGDRGSFGRPLASYQAIKHRIADMKMWIEGSHGVTELAVQAVQDDDPDAAEIVSAAASYLGDHAGEILQECTQLHGGIGVTWEHDLHLYLRRVTLDRNLFGTPAQHRERIADRIITKHAPTLEPEVARA